MFKIGFISVIFITSYFAGNAQQSAINTKVVDDTAKVYDYTDVDKQPEYPDGDGTLSKFITDGVNLTDELKAKKIKTHFDIKFVIAKNGNVKDIKVLDMLETGLTNQITNTFKKMQQWTPALVNGAPVNCQFSVGFAIFPDTNKTTGEITTTSFTFVERMPSYLGGQNAMVSYLSKNVHYPKQARKKGVQGRVVVSFVIDETGSVTDATLINDLGDGCGAEALRVVNAMPKWKPGRQNGNVVKVEFKLPITFQLSN